MKEMRRRGLVQWMAPPCRSWGSSVAATGSFSFPTAQRWSLRLLSSSAGSATCPPNSGRSDTDGEAGYPSSFDLLSENLVAEGKQQEVQRNWEAALRLYGEVVSHNPKLPAAYAARADLLVRLGRHQEALSDYGHVRTPGLWRGRESSS